MALRTNVVAGTLAGPWVYNDFLSLLTGVMADQIVTLKTDVVLKALGGAPGAPTVALAAGTTMNIGAFKYVVTFIDANGGETVAGTPSAVVTTTSGNQNVAVTAIPTGPTGTTQRKLYRTLAGGSVYYLIAGLGDNTTTTYTDIYSDAAISSNPNPPAHPSFGGTLSIKDSTGTVQATIYSDGAIVGSSISVSGGAPSFSALTVTGVLYANGSINIGGGVNVYYANLSGVYYGTVFKALQATAGNYEGYIFQTWKNTALVNALSIGDNNPGVSAANIDNSGNYSGGTVNGLTIAGDYIKSNASFLGFKNSSGTKLAEMKSDGSLTIGTNYIYNNAGQGTTYFQGGVFDTFDVAEVYPVTELFPNGTVVCLGDDGVYHRCQHDACPVAMIVSHKPGLAVGFIEDGSLAQYLALAGRIRCASADTSTAPRGWVTADGRGGVRAMRPGESGFALGYALTQTQDGMVGIVVRPMFCQA